MYTRREFGKLTIVGLPLVGMPLLALGQGKISGVRIGVQSYSFRTMELDAAIAAMKDIGIGECELFSGHVEPRMGPPPGMGGGQRPPQGAAPGQGQAPTPEQREAMREAARKRAEEVRKWRLSVSMDHFTGIRKKFDAAGIKLQAYNLSFNDSFSDEEIDRGFEMAKALGVKLITASSTLKAAKRVAPFADKHKITVAMHGHSNLTDPNEFAKPESFEAALAMSKYFAINLDVGHFFAAGFDPIDYIQKHHAHITNLHLKDRKKDNGPNVPWGEGDTPIKAVLQLLKTKKYDIPANIEYEYRGADTVAEVRKCFQYIKGALA
ncbi:MAG: sugar phosphate isomerase/epimerase [Acidobacteria bacterium]|nr:sugar phosphate isomerase/epimerase [Acidobacteriota bacterium]